MVPNNVLHHFRHGVKQKSNPPSRLQLQRGSRQADLIYYSSSSADLVTVSTLSSSPAQSRQIFSAINVSLLDINFFMLPFLKK